jgi:hypothetical protein
LGRNKKKINIKTPDMELDKGSQHGSTSTLKDLQEVSFAPDSYPAPSGGIDWQKF